MPSQLTAMMGRPNRERGPRVNDNCGTTTSRFRDFMRMNPLIFLGSKVGEDLQEFVDEVCKVLSAMGVTLRDKADLASYQLKDIVQICVHNGRTIDQLQRVL